MDLSIFTELSRVLCSTIFGGGGARALSPTGTTVDSSSITLPGPSSSEPPKGTLTPLIMKLFSSQSYLQQNLKIKSSPMRLCLLYPTITKSPKISTMVDSPAQSRVRPSATTYVALTGPRVFFS